MQKHHQEARSMAERRGLQKVYEALGANPPFPLSS